ncbi:MAG: hypothetical protein JOZ15_11295 [Acidobacteria bacterium]|nr:hypothetical protein [Acidobacteriota bacterium]
MLTYTVEVCGVIGLVVVCLALPVTAIGLGVDALRSAFRQRRRTDRKRAAAV